MPLTNDEKNEIAHLAALATLRGLGGYGSPELNKAGADVRTQIVNGLLQADNTIGDHSLAYVLAAIAQQLGVQIFPKAK